MTAELNNMLTASPQTVLQATSTDQDESAFLRLGTEPVHILALPLHRKDQLVGGIAIVHDVSYIRAESMRLWRQTFFGVLVQVFLIVLITLLIVRWSIAGPIAKAAQWMRAMRTGRITALHKMPDLDMFRPLAREVATMAASL